MRSEHRPAVVACAVLALVALPSRGLAQGGGSRGGLEPVPPATTAPAALDHFAAEHYISIQGSAEVRVEPTELRVVLALTEDNPTAEECHTKMNARVATLTSELQAQGVGPERVFVDFISLLPRYAWGVEKQEGRDVAVERLDGFVLQTNVHLALADEGQARSAVGTAAGLGVPDVLAFDYWSADLDAVKAQAHERALAEARRKADLMLGLFETRPGLINVHESTRVLQPRMLYRSFQNQYAGAIQMSYRGDLPAVSAPRPQNTYYHGPPGGTDVQSAELPMRPQLSVISKVTLYFAAPDRPAPCPHHDGR